MTGRLASLASTATFIAKAGANARVELLGYDGNVSFRVNDKGQLIIKAPNSWVYCLRASGVELVWRFRAAPGERHIFARGQLESTLPVSGSVLVAGDVAFFAAGRASLFDNAGFSYSAWFHRSLFPVGKNGTD